MKWHGYDLEYAQAHEKQTPFCSWEYHEMLQLHTPSRGDRVLDIGCNTGDFCYFVASRCGCDVKGIDINQDAIRMACQKYPEMPCQVGDVMNLVESGRYDAIYMQHVIEHLTDPSAALSVIWKLLEPGGVLALCCPNRWAYPSRTVAWMVGRRFCDDPSHRHWFSPFDIRKLLAHNGFHKVTVTTKPLGIPVEGMADALWRLYAAMPAMAFGAYIFTVASKL